MSSTQTLLKALSGGWCKKAIQMLTIALGVVLLCLPAFSQGNLGRVMGTVTDQSGGVVAGATVTVIDTARGITRTLTTDDAGEYNAPNLTPGNFTVRVEAKGFKKLERQSVDVGVGKEIRVDVTLQPGEQEQTVTVTEAVPLVETTNATLGGTLDNTDIVDMPLNGRNYQLLLGLRPGVMVQPGGGPWTQSTNGVRPDESVWLIDGVINSNFFDGRPIMGMPSPITDGATILPVDAIQEFNTMENPKAEYGWKPGAVVNVGLKSGTNQFHGSAYAFGRDQSWDARNAFNPAPDGGTCVIGALSQCDKLPVQLKQFGGVAGGPIKKDKLFFFGGYEGLRSLIGNSFTTGGVPADFQAINPAKKPNCPAAVLAANPTADCNGSFVDAINGLNAMSVPVSAASLKLACPNAAGQALPLPSSFECQGGFWPQGQTTTSFLSSFPNVNQSDNGIGKLDYHMNDKNTISGFLAISRYEAVGEDHPYISSDFENGFPIKTLTATANWIYTPNSSMVNEVRVGYDRMTISQTSNDATLTDPLDTGLTTPGFPTMKIKSLNNFGTQHNRPQVSGPNPYYDFQDSLSFLKGKHSFKFGGEWTHIEGDSNIPDTGRGQFNFNGGQAFSGSTALEDLLAGTPSAGLAFVGNANRVMRWTNTAAFFQDDWRVSSKLTVNFGLRYSYDSPIREINNQWANFDPTSSTGLVQQGSQGAPTMWNPDYKNLSPRVGFAYDLNGKGTTVVRGGFSVMYSSYTAVMWMNQNSFQDTTASALGANPTGLPLVFCPGGTPCATPTTIPGTANGIAAAIGTFQLSGLCWDPSVTSGPALSKENCASGQKTVFPTSAGSPLSCGDGIGSDPSPCSLMGVDPNLKTPYVENYNLGIQHQFGTNLSLEIGYVGNHGARLLGFNEINQAPAGAGYCLNALTAAQLADQCKGFVAPTTQAGWNALAGAGVNGQAAQEARPYFSKFPYFGYINWMSNSDHSYYNSLQTTLTKRMSHGLSFIAGYTYAHGLDNGSLNRFSLLPQDAAVGSAGEYGNSDFDVRHRLTLTATYNIPGIKGYGQVLEGWQVNAIANIQSSQPWLVNDAGDNFAGTNDNTDRWDFSGNPGSFQSTADGIPLCTGPTSCTTTSTITGIVTPLSNASTLWGDCLSQATTPQKMATLNTIGCFVSANGSGVMTPNALGSFGNMGRNIFRDSGFRGFDFSVFKNFTWKERFGAQFRVEVFNILNHPIYANPYGASSNFNSNNDPSAGGGFGGTCGTPDVCAGNNIVGSGANRDLQLGLKLTF